MMNWLILAKAADGPPPLEEINTQGWIMMIASMGLVLCLLIYCFTKVLIVPSKDVTDHLKAPLDIDTGDRS